MGYSEDLGWSWLRRYPGPLKKKKKIKDSIEQSYDCGLEVTLGLQGMPESPRVSVSSSVMQGCMRIPELTLGRLQAQHLERGLL